MRRLRLGEILFRYGALFVLAGALVLGFVIGRLTA